MLMGRVFVCKFRRAWGRITVKMHVAVHASLEQELQAVVAVLVSEGGKLKRGQAATRGFGERIEIHA